MLGKYVVSDLELESIQVPTQLSWGSAQFQKTLQSPTSDLRELKRRQLLLFALRHKDAAEVRESISAHLNGLSAATSVVDELESKDGLDPRIQESIEQIYWPRQSMLAKLNETPYTISALSFWKTLVLPTLAVVVPFLALVLPFFLLRYLHHMEISPATYMAHIRQIVLKQITIPPILRAKHEADILGHILESGFLVLTAATYISGIWSQVTAAQHLRAIATGLHEKGEALARIMRGFVGILESLHSLPPRLQAAMRPFLLRAEKIRADLADIPSEGGYRTYGYLWNHPTALMEVKIWLGELDAIVGIVGIRDICFPQYGGVLRLEGVYHPSLLPDARVSNTVAWSDVGCHHQTCKLRQGRNLAMSVGSASLTNASYAQYPVRKCEPDILHHVATCKSGQHAILTGPNRGGKSTLCRAVGISLICAQSWGFAFADRMDCTPYEYIETALHPADTVGERSLFEAEIEFAKGVLALAKKGRLFVMMDEIFHSTNARDGLEASRVFLRQLYATSGTSLISTHYKELPVEFGDSVLAWAMEAEDGENGCLKYSYKMVAGVSDKSSVMEILRERGLLGVAIAVSLES